MSVEAETSRIVYADPSPRNQQPVAFLVAQSLGPSLQLSLMAMLIALAIALPVGATSFISATRPDPDLVLGYRFAAGGAGNYSAWVHPEVEAAVSEGRSTYDTAGCQAAYEKLQTVVHQEAYYEFIWRRKQTVAATSALMDLEPTLSNSSLDKKRAQGVGVSSGFVRSVSSSGCVQNRRTGDAYPLP